MNYLPHTLFIVFFFGIATGYHLAEYRLLSATMGQDLDSMDDMERKDYEKTRRDMLVLMLIPLIGCITGIILEVVLV